MYEKYINEIIMSKDDSKMEDLKCILLDAISYIKNADKNVYKNIETDIYEIANGYVLDEQAAIDWVSSMKPSAKWNLEEIRTIKSKYDTPIDLIPLYVIMNMLYSDLGDIIGEDINPDTINKYIKASEDWYYDADSNKTEDEKLYYYHKYIIL